MNKGRVLGIDFGLRHLGLALSDPSGTVALPLRVQQSQGLGADIEQIVSLVAEYDIQAVVVGVPRRLNQSESPTTCSAFEFICQLRRSLSVPVDQWDERYSSVEAEKALASAGQSRRQRAARVDAAAAALILQSYLDSHQPDR